MNSFAFSLVIQDKKTRARTGVIHTPHGDIKTPAFVPVGTQATVKSLSPEELKELDVHLFFVNTYHMVLRPGVDVIKKFDGLHEFMQWDRPLITDSGGFQVFSLGAKRFARRNEEGNGEASLVRITDDGVTFKSHWDGKEYMFTAENSMRYQWDLGSDIHIAFDDCTPYPVTQKQAARSMERTHAWAIRSLDEHTRICHDERVSASKGTSDGSRIKSGMTRKNYQALYGSIQGSVYENLRKKSAQFITSLPFDGFAIGGVSVGESKKEMVKVLQWVTPYLPEDKPRHLLGVGEIDDIFALVEYGMDTFDCVQPTRLARMGQVFVHTEAPWTMDITKQDYSQDTTPIEATCQCYTCRQYSRAYIHHLFRVHELLAYRLASIHNIFYIQSLVSDIRSAISKGTFLELKRKWIRQ